MSRVQGVKAWHILYGISLLLYLINASLTIYIQFEYYVNPSFIEPVMALLPPTYVSQLNGDFQLGLFGIVGTVSIILVLIMMYIVVNALQGKAHEVGKSIKVTLLVLFIIQIFLGNVGLILGLIIGLISLALMR
ncbi:hypothetical protein [Vulcanisaeta sp. JCM 16159]|uniref:hypothetical protein n=1 Tax=Vulcanisaeta sp. JCM 16159 TaxID=1295371 RepID=UPI0006D1331C|nr:hypothetical protein [Vulcanisaeta sp. JCM 16159]